MNSIKKRRKKGRRYTKHLSTPHHHCRHSPWTMLPRWRKRTQNDSGGRAQGGRKNGIHVCSYGQNFLCRGGCVLWGMEGLLPSMSGQEEKFHGIGKAQFTTINHHSTDFLALVSFIFRLPLDAMLRLWVVGFRSSFEEGGYREAGLRQGTCCRTRWSLVELVVQEWVKSNWITGRQLHSCFGNKKYSNLLRDSLV